MRGLFVVLSLMSAVPALAQVHTRPTATPLVTAEREAWYRGGEPVVFAGDEYHRAGARVFFNGNTMVRTGDHNGVPLYTDTTLEPYSIVYVPVERGQLQPYERRRRGDLAGTTGSRTPSFVVSSATASTVDARMQAALSPPPPTPYAASPVEPPAFTARVVAVASPVTADPDVFSLMPEGFNGIWVVYDGAKWWSDGQAVLLRSTDHRLVGTYAGFPVFASRGATDDVIYVPSRAGLVAPYRREP